MSTPWQDTARSARRPPLAAEPLHRDARIPLLSGNAMPVLGLGSWMLTSHTTEAVQHAFELGYRMVDTAPDYMTQDGIGRAIRRFGAPRDSLFIVMKVEPEGNSYDATLRNLEELKLAYADLVLIHEAPEHGVGEPVWEGLMRARDDGLTRDIGVCSYKIDQLRTLAQNTGEWPAVHQLEWSPFGHSLDMLSFCDAHEIVLQAYSPLTTSMFETVCLSGRVQAY